MYRHCNAAPTNISFKTCTRMKLTIVIAEPSRECSPKSHMSHSRSIVWLNIRTSKLPWCR